MSEFLSGVNWIGLVLFLTCVWLVLDKIRSGKVMRKLAEVSDAVSAPNVGRGDAVEIVRRVQRIVRGVE